MKSLNYNQLYYFYVVATSGSIKGASQQLHLTQPTISTQIKALEQSLNVKLFDRQHRKLELTDVGKKIVKKAERIFTTGDELLHEMNSTKPYRQTRLNLGLSLGLPLSLRGEIFNSIIRDESFAVNSVTKGSSQLLKDLQLGELDAVVADLRPASSGKSFRVDRLVDSEFILLASEKESQLKKRFPASLHDYPMIELMDHPAQTDFNQWLASEGVYCQNIGKFDDASLIFEAVGAGKGVGLFPNVMKSTILKRNGLILLKKLDWLKFSIFLITPNLSKNRPIQRKLAKDIKPIFN